MLESEQAAPKVRTLRILLVEDEPDLRNFYRLTFEEIGCTVTATATAHEAAAAALRDPFDIAVLDERLPDRRGLALLRWLKRRFPKMIALLVSAYADWEMYFRACRYGAADVVPKGQSTKELLRVLEHCIREDK